MIVDPRLNFVLRCDRLKIGHVVLMLACDWITPPPILSPRGQVLFTALVGNTVILEGY